MSHISFVFFDLDDTLLDHKRAERLALADVHVNFPSLHHSSTLEIVQDVYHDVNADVWRRYGAAEISKERAKLERFELLLSRLGVKNETDPGLLSEAYMDRYSHNWSYLPGAKQAFLSIAARRSVGILTNGFIEVQHEKLRQFSELRDRSKTVVISEEVGFMKPDVRIFKFATEQAGVDAETVLYIGDSYRSDILGGSAAGWQTAWLNEADQTGADVDQFANWPELMDWLNRKFDGFES